MLLSFAAQGLAQEKTKPKIIIHGDVSVPADPAEFSDGFSLGLGGGVGIAYPLSTRFGVVADIAYKVFGVDEEGFRRTFQVPPGAALLGDGISSLYASLNIKFDFVTAPSQIRPYIVGGVGYFRLEPDDFSSDGSPLGFETDNTWGANIGGGLQAVLAPYLGLFLDVMYVVGFTENEETSFVTFRPGVAFDWKAGQ